MPLRRTRQTFAPSARSKGRLPLRAQGRISRAQFARFVGPYGKGGYRQFPRFATCYTAPVIRIQSEKNDIVTCLDGECSTSSDVTFRLSDRKLNFFGPTGCSPDATRRT